MKEFWRAFSKNKVAVIAFAVVVIIALLAIFAPWITPQDPYDLKSLVLRDARRPPGYVGAGACIICSARTVRDATCCQPLYMVCAYHSKWD